MAGGALAGDLDPAADGEPAAAGTQRGGTDVSDVDVGVVQAGGFFRAGDPRGGEPVRFGDP
ncbi:hypothetical protein GCM10009780_71970 [Actinomadura alba]